MQCLQIDKLAILFLSSAQCSRFMFWISRESDNREMDPRNRYTFILIFKKSDFPSVMAYSVSEVGSFIILPCSDGDDFVTRK